MSPGPDFTGVKRPAFDTMADQHTAAAGRLADLATRLHGELTAAGLDTLPATRIRDLARQARTQAEDLRRRRRLVDELEREKVVFGTSTAAGSFVPLPDKLETGQAMLDGAAAADAAIAAHTKLPRGKVLPEQLAVLQRYAAKAHDPAFAKAFMSRLGARGVTDLANAIWQEKASWERAGDHEGAKRAAAQGDHVLRMLSTTLAAATDPDSPAYLGAGFLQRLKAAGRTSRDVHSVTGGRPTAYHDLADVLGAHPGKPPYSAEFMRTVGRDMIALDREVHDALKNGEGTKVMSDMRTFVPDLLRAAASRPAAAQALLDHTPAGRKTTNLHYLLHDRVAWWTDNPHSTADDRDARALGAAMEAAMKGSDPVSLRLTAETLKILGADLPPLYARNTAEKLQLADQAGFDQRASLRPALGTILSAHIDELGRIIEGRNVLKSGVGETLKDQSVNRRDIDYALLLATSDDAVFAQITRAQAEHTRVEIDRIFPLTDKGPRLVDPLSKESKTFGHILGAREQALYSAGRANEAAAKELESMVRSAIGIVPVPGKEFAGKLAEQAFKGMRLEGFAKEVAGEVGGKPGTYAFDKGASWIAGFFKNGKMLDESYATATENRELVNRLMEQMVATATVAHGQHDGQGLKGRSFIDENGRMKPIIEMTPAEYEAFLNWAADHSGFNSQKAFSEGIMNDGAEEARRSYGVAD
ncbi:hypothetical protein E1295_40950 [Nonomuraea mesophila]|uniref:Uncharacterized protein n=1 Tax=Nonomuraea mesophila TaxID=2530382 RepID=A0A4R5EBR1_9ACTN|nr:hypothetical protein [Nonomuraea mesophila]TDE30705.1 hypothetical protein E1295_40950 [Nonomuraea mesophila]